MYSFLYRFSKLNETEYIKTVKEANITTNIPHPAIFVCNDGIDVK